MQSMELKCPCGARLRVVYDPERGSGGKNAFRCPRCGALRSALGPIAKISRYLDGEWVALSRAEWADAWQD